MKRLFNKEELHEIVEAKYNSMKLNKQEGIDSEWYEFIFEGTYEERLDKESVMEEFTEVLESAIKVVEDDLKRLDIYNMACCNTQDKEEEVQQLKQSIMNKVTPILADFLNT